jgi:hypothetical protein
MAPYSNYRLRAPGSDSLSFQLEGKINFLNIISKISLPDDQGNPKHSSYVYMS